MFEERTAEAFIGGLGEVVGDARLKFNVGDTKGLAERTREALEKRGRTTELQRRSRQRALAFFGQTRMLSEHVPCTSERWAC